MTQPADTRVVTEDRIAFVGCKVQRSTSTSVPHNTFSGAVQFTDADIWDTDGIHDPSVNPSRLTVPAGLGGRWRAEVHLAFAAEITGNRLAQWLVNGSVISDANNYIAVPSSGTVFQTIVYDSRILLLSAGDYLEVRAVQTSGASLNLDSADLAFYRI